MKRILSNKYFWVILFFLYDYVVFAHDCSSPGDCEETAGYNAAVAITGGLIAIGVGLMTSWLPTREPDVDEEEENEEPDDFREDDFEGFSEEEDTDEDLTEEEEEDPDDFREEDFEGFGEEEDTDEDLTEEEEDSDEFEEEDFEGFGEDEDTDEDLTEEEEEDSDEFKEDDFEGFGEDEDTDEDLSEEEEDSDEFKEDDFEGFGEDEDTDKDLTDKENKDPGKKDTDLLDETQKVMDTSNNIKTLLQSLGARGVKIWQGMLKGEEYKNAARHYKDIIDRLKNKGLNNLANKYAVKLNKLLKGKANRLIVTRTKGAKSLFRNLKSIESLGKLADLLTFLNNVNKKTKGGTTELDVTTGAVAEEILRVGLKTFLTKNPVIAIGDAALSVAGLPNLDAAIDKSIDKYKEGVTAVAEHIYRTPSDNAEFNKRWEYHKARINKMNLSQAEKNKKLSEVYKILVKHS